MNSVRFTDWHNGVMWIGYLEEFPEYRTQGLDLDELHENLRDLCAEITSGAILGIRRIVELQFA